MPLPVPSPRSGSSVLFPLQTLRGFTLLVFHTPVSSPDPGFILQGAGWSSGNAERCRGTAGSFQPFRAPCVSPQLRELSPAEEIGELPQKKRHEPLGVPSPTVPPLFPQRDRSRAPRSAREVPAGGGCGTRAPQIAAQEAPKDRRS